MKSSTYSKKSIVASKISTDFATLSNCGKPLRAKTTKVFIEIYYWPRIILGYGNNVLDWAIRSQASSKIEEGSTTK